MRIRINGQDFFGFDFAEVSRSFISMSGKFIFKTSPTNIGDVSDIEVQDECQILVEDKVFLSGFIEKIEVNDSYKNPYYAFCGRDITSLLYKSSAPRNFTSQFDGQSNMVDLTSEAINNLGLSSYIGVYTNLSLEPFPTSLYNSFFAGENVFDYLQRYAHASSVVLTTDGDSNIVVDRGVGSKPDAKLLPFALSNEYDGDNNNVYSVQYSDDISEQYQTYNCYNQLTYSYLGYGADNSNAIDRNNPFAQSFDSSIKYPSTWTFIEDSSGASPSLQDRVNWEVNYRRANRERYKCVVQGHTYDGTNIWEPNNLVFVNDEKARVFKAMMIESVGFSESVHQGKTTELNLVNELCYTLKAQIEAIRAIASTKNRVSFS